MNVVIEKFGLRRFPWRLYFLLRNFRDITLARVFGVRHFTLDRVSETNMRYVLDRMGISFYNAVPTDNRIPTISQTLVLAKGPLVIRFRRGRTDGCAPPCSV